LCWLAIIPRHSIYSRSSVAAKSDWSFLSIWHIVYLAYSTLMMTDMGSSD
jgi:hypothetical protein